MGTAPPLDMRRRAILFAGNGGRIPVPACPGLKSPGSGNGAAAAVPWIPGDAEEKTVKGKILMADREEVWFGSA